MIKIECAHEMSVNLGLNIQVILPRKNYNVYKILPHSSGLLKIDAKRPENNYYNYSNYVFKLKK